MRPFTVAVFAAVLAQYLAATLLFTYVGATATTGMIAAMMYYVCMVPYAVRAAARRWPAFVVTRGAGLRHVA